MCIRDRRKYDERPYGGYYTQDQIRDIVQYASDRFITVIPEIEMPGHATAALAAYPYLGCIGKDYKVATLYGIQPDAFCAGKDSTFFFLEDVLTEVMDLFPSEYIHIGGDECQKDRWAECPYCQKRIRDEHLKNETELQSYFVHRIDKFLSSKGRRVLGWDEILEGGDLSKNAAVMSWRCTTGGIEAAKHGNHVVMSPYTFCYLSLIHIYQCFGSATGQTSGSCSLLMNLSTCYNTKLSNIMSGEYAPDINRIPPYGRPVATYNALA